MTCEIMSRHDDAGRVSAIKITEVRMIGRHKHRKQIIIDSRADLVVLASALMRDPGIARLALAPSMVDVETEPEDPEIWREE